MATTLESSIIRIRRKHDKMVVGAGFFVTEKLVLTCAHVVCEALGISQDSLEIPTQEVLLDFALVAPGDILTAKVIKWLPVQPDGGGDIAGLELLSRPPKEAHPTQLIAAEDFWGHSFRAFGFPSGYDQGVWASGVLRSKLADGWVQIEDIKHTGYFIKPGFSGTAIWDDEANGIVGMTVAVDREPEVRAAFMIPVSRILDLVPELQPQTIPLCPYRGLFAFREQDERFFFGRESYTQKLVEAVRKQSFIAVIGASGSGKSSLVYAGLIPRLRRQSPLEGGRGVSTPSSEGQGVGSIPSWEGSGVGIPPLRGARGVSFPSQEIQGWLIASFRPGERPFHNISTVLVPFLEPELDEIDRISKIKKLAQKFTSGELNLTDIISAVIEKYPDSRLLLFADQFEELYTLCQNDDERRQFLDELLSILPNFPTPYPPISIILTLRADFLGKALAYRPFADALQGSDIILGPMNRDELRETIERPAKALEVEIEDGLTDRILDAVGDEPGNLPLLEFALTELWNKQTNGMLTHAAYDDIGGVEQALASYAEGVYTALTADEQNRAQRIFTQLVRPGEDTEDTRRVARCADVGKENWDLVMKLADARLVVTGGGQMDATSESSAHLEENVEVVHETMIKGWQRLWTWVEADRVFRTWQEHLRFAMHQWVTNNHDEGALLRGAPLEEAGHWLGQRQNDLNQEEQHFIETSLEHRDREIAEREAQQRRELETAKRLAEEQRQRAEEQAKAAKKLRNRFVIAMVLVIIAVLAAIFAVYGFKQAKEQTELAKKNEKLANQQKKLAQQERSNASINAIEALNQTSRMLFLSHDHLGSLLASVKASSLLQNLDAPEELQKQTILGLREVVQNIHEKNRLEGHNSLVENITFSPDGTLLASASQDGTVKLWNVADGREITTLKGHTAFVVDVAFHPKGRLLASGGYDNNIKLWNVINGQEIATLQGHSGDIYSLTFSPDGNILASGSTDNTIKLWNVENYSEITTLSGHSGDIFNLAFSPDGKLLASGSGDETIKLWDIGDKQEIMMLKGDFGEIQSVDFSLDGTWFAFGSSDDTIKLWNMVNEKEIHIEAMSGGIFSVKFSPDSRMLASGGWDGAVRLWQVSTGKQLGTFYGHSKPIYSVAFNPDGTLLASGSFDTTIKIWKSAKDFEIPTLVKHDGSVRSVTFSPDSSLLASGSADNTLRLWDISKGRERTKLFGHNDDIISIAFNSDGKMLASGSWQEVKLWNFATGEEIDTLKGHADWVQEVTFSSDDMRLISGSSDGMIKVWDVAGRREISSFKGYVEDSRRVAVSSDGTLFASGSYDGIIKIWNIIENREIASLQEHTHIRELTFSPDGTRFASGHWDGTITLWNVFDGQKLVTLSGHSLPIHSLTFSSNGTLLASGSSDHTIRLWNVADAECITTLRGHESTVYSVAFSPDGTWFASGSSDHTIRLWNIRELLKGYDVELDDLLRRGCEWLRDYLKTNPNVSEEDRILCDDILKSDMD